MTTMQTAVGHYGTVRTGGVAAALIRFGTRSPVNHAFVYIGENLIVEAQPGGAVISPVEKYPDAHWSTIRLAPRQARTIAMAARGMVGSPYGWPDIAALSLACYGIRSKRIDEYIEDTDRLICSQLVDLAYREAGIELFDDGRLPGEVTPGDLYNLAL